MSKIENGGLDQYGAEPFEQQQFGPAGVDRVNHNTTDTARSDSANSAENKHQRRLERLTNVAHRPAVSTLAVTHIICLVQSPTASVATQV